MQHEYIPSPIKYSCKKMLIMNLIKPLQLVFSSLKTNKQKIEWKVKWHH